jgi:hypothetical protein
MTREQPTSLRTKTLPRVAAAGSSVWKRTLRLGALLGKEAWEDQAYCTDGSILLYCLQSPSYCLYK